MRVQPFDVTICVSRPWFNTEIWKTCILQTTDIIHHRRQLWASKWKPGERPSIPWSCFFKVEPAGCLPVGIRWAGLVVSGDQKCLLVTQPLWEFIAARRAGGFDHYNILHVFFFLAHTFVSFISTMSHWLKLWIMRNVHVEIEHVNEEPKNDLSEFTRRFFQNKKQSWKV